MNTQNLLKGFKRPKEVLKSVDQANKFAGRFIVEPLERGFGITVGNALRRTLLSSLPGYAIVAVKLEHVLHEFTTIKGVIEDVPEIVLNLKQVALTLQNQGESRILEFEKKGEGVVKARDLEVDSDVKVFNPDLHIATLSAGGHLKMKLQVELGRGYVSADDIKDRIDEEGVIALDAMFTPVRKVNYTVEDLRLGNRSDYNRLVLDIETNGSLTAEEAVGSASKVLKEIFVRFIHFKDVDEKEDEIEDDDRKKVESRAQKILKMPVEDLELSVRSLHCLQGAEVHSVEELVRRSDDELIKTKNFGKKSLQEMKEKLEKFNLRFGMTDADIEQYLATVIEETVE
jgi:DNA-directed RNA polymerase subunit alpha